MLNVSIQRYAEITVLHCVGQIVAGDENATLCAAVVSNASTPNVILDLTEVDRIDAAGLGLMVQLLTWTVSKGMELELMNVARRVKDLIEVVHLNHVFSMAWNGDEMLLSRPAADRDRRSDCRAVFRLPVVDF
jgi:anti-anti-sigma factor